MSATMNIKAKLTILHDMRPATDDESTRYGKGLSCVQAIPRDGGAYLCATNGRIAAVATAAGECAETVLLPPEVLPSKAAHWGKAGAVDVEVNGECRASFGSFAKRPEDDGAAFPKVDQVLPSVNGEGYFAVSIDPQLLLDLATALGRAERVTRSTDETAALRGITLFVSRDKTAGGIIGVMGARGIGAIMPCVNNDDTAMHSAGEWEKFAQGFRGAAETARKAGE